MRAPAWAVAFSPDSRYLALGGVEPDIILCDLKTGWDGTPLGVPILRTTALAYSHDGLTLAATSGSENEIILWDLAAGRTQMTLRLLSPPDRLRWPGLSVAGFRREGRPGIVIWDLATGRPRARLEVRVLRSGRSPFPGWSPCWPRPVSASVLSGSGNRAYGRLVHLIEGHGQR